MLSIDKIHLGDCLKNFPKIPNNSIDLVFLDPPYRDKNLIELFKKLENLKILKSDSIIILHRHKNEKDSLPSSFRIIEEKKYGISKIFFIEYLK